MQSRTSIEQQLQQQTARSFASLMEIYEHNYFQLRTLMQRLPATDWDNLVLTGDDGMSLHLTLLEESPYTTTWHLSYFFVEDNGERIADPDLEVRIYHDTRQAEALYCGNNQHCVFLRDYRAEVGTPLDRKWQINMLLHKWLGYIIGHHYSVPTN